MRTIKRLVLAIMIVMSVDNISAKVIDEAAVVNIVGEMTFNDASIDGKLLQRGASQVAALWQGVQEVVWRLGEPGVYQ